jgi:histidine triad (HIT) family protein
MSDCLFCRMASGDIKPDLVYEDEEIIAFRDINPQAPVHCLVIPRRHITAIDTLEARDAGLVGRMFLVAKRVAEEQGLASGYRTVINCREDGGQTVFHLHLHVLGGRRMNWPPG